MATIVPAQQTAIANLYVALFNRAPDAAGFGFWVQSLSNGAPLSSITSAFLSSPESRAIYPSSQTSEQFITTFYTTVFGRAPDAAGLAFWAGVVNANGGSSLDAAKAAAVIQIINVVSTPLTTKPADITDAQYAQTVADRGAFQNKVVVGTYYAVDAKGASIDSAKLVLVGVDATAASVTAAKLVADGAANAGSTFALTAGADTLNGTSGNDTFIADLSTGTAALGVADTINGGAGVDTLKIFLAAAATIVPTATLSSIENVTLNGGRVTAYTALTGTTGLTIEAPVLTAGALATATYTVAGQTVTLKGVTTTANSTTTIASAADVAATIVLNGWGGANLNTVNLSGTKVATLNLTSTGSASTFNLTNTGGVLKTLNIAGDKAVTIEGGGAGGLTAIDASTATAAVTINVASVVRTAAFAFTGGAGNDTLILRGGDFNQLTSGAQLNGGAGTDTIVIQDTTLDGKIYAGLNAAKGFEVLGLDFSGTTVDAAQLTSIKAFAIGSAGSTETINNLGAGTSVSITAATAQVNLGAALGNRATDITLGTATAAGFITTALTATGLTTLSLTSNGTSLNTITTLTNSDNTTLTIKGAADLTITNALAGGTTGSKVDATAFTGKLVVIGSGVSDIIIGGSGDDTITGGAGVDVADTLTGGLGKDKFITLGGTTLATADTIMDFVTTVDTLSFNGVAVGIAADFTKGAAAVADFATALAAANVVLTSTAAVQYNVQQVGADTFVFFNDGAVAGADQVVKLAGVSLAGITFADIVA